MEHSTTAPPPWEVYRDLDPSVPLSLSSIIFPIICPFCCQTLAMAGTQGQLFPLPLSLLNKRQSHRLNANWLNCTLEFSRRKTFLFVCLPGVTLKHCFLAGLTLSIDHIFLLWEACFNHIQLPLLIQSSRKMVDSTRYRCSSRSFVLQ